MPDVLVINKIQILWTFIFIFCSFVCGIGVDYSTIERDYASSAGNTLTSTRDGHHLVVDRDGEMGSLAANKSRTNEISTRGMSGPASYRPNEYSMGSNRAGGPVDLPNIDIGYTDKKTNSNRSQNRVQFPDTRPNYTSSSKTIISFLLFAITSALCNSINILKRT